MAQLALSNLRTKRGELREALIGSMCEHQRVKALPGRKTVWNLTAFELT
jgi:hypothetical protein